MSELRKGRVSQQHGHFSEGTSLIGELRDLADVRSFLDSALPREGIPTLNNLRHVVDRVGEPHQLNSIIESVLRDPDQISEISIKSFGHSTGMERIQLASQGQYSLRLHLWMPDAAENFTEDPHNHVYKFGSKVLSGALATDLFIAEDGEEMDMYEIASQEGVVAPQPECIGTARLRVITPLHGVVLTPSHPSYGMVPSTIHRARIADMQNPLITLNIRGGAIKDRSTFFRERGVLRPDPTVNPIDVEDRLSLLHRVLTA